MNSYIDGFYQQRQTIKVTRTQHALVIGVHADARALKAALARIPDNARIVEVEEYENSDKSLVTHASLRDASVYIFEIEERDND